ncbi:MAG: superoxide dismutase family protein [Clostridia bacterium]|nr:superoxide dismutase family protein [Clostridia bacterium]
MKIKNVNFFSNMIMTKNPYAKAELMGSPLAPGLSGTVSFYPAHNGTLVVTEVYGLPAMMPPAPNAPPIGPFGFHIHEGNVCDVGNPADPYKSAMDHYNPSGMPHPDHAGDLPVLFSNNGYAFMVVFTDKFTPDQVVNRSVVIHQNPDDYRSQPAGNSGKRIACGVIRKL